MALWTVYAVYDPEARVWVAEETDVPGLATEADTLEALAAKLEVMVGEMVEGNAQHIHPSRRGPPHEFRLIAHHEIMGRAA